MELETNNFEENIPLEEKNEWREDEEGYFLETSFGGADEPLTILMMNPNLLFLILGVKCLQMCN